MLYWHLKFSAWNILKEFRCFDIPPCLTLSITPNTRHTRPLLTSDIPPKYLKFFLSLTFYSFCVLGYYSHPKWWALFCFSTSDFVSCHLDTILRVLCQWRKRRLGQGKVKIEEVFTSASCTSCSTLSDPKVGFLGVNACLPSPTTRFYFRFKTPTHRCIFQSRHMYWWREPQDFGSFNSPFDWHLTTCTMYLP
jgi:hypothetical protein